jgi:hypothetical protein
MKLRRWACAGIVAGTLAVATPAFSQTYTGVTTPTVADNSVRQPSVTTPAARGDLAVTGADILEMVAIGAFGISAGAVGMRMSRARVRPTVA